ncbi:pentatricopeptide repeat-containing protein At2g33680 [Gossypium hirsutum]|uniref:Pentatricopeptide repeat-containing protein At2g33680 n=1 Tax=Gossypium hirsutum TaxID=3635 RepID=A0ABM3BHW2_GOSHI|nr:pentatricopeptide repeat-containing protein At2g33680-like [Gossypium hirsutum]
MEAAYGATVLLHPFKPQNPVFLTKAKLPVKAKYPSLKKVNCSISSISTNKELVLAEDWPHLLKLSIGSGNFLLGQAIHAFLIKSNSSNDVFQGNNLINFYTKSNELDDARKVFDEIPVRNTITWTTLIKGHLNNGDSESVFRIAHDMYFSGEKFNEHTCSVILQACSEEEDLIRGIEEGRQLHGLAVKYGVVNVTSLGNALITMYGKLGMVEDSERMFHSLSERNLISWTALISGYVRNGCSESAADIFLELFYHGIYCDPSCLVTVLDGCSECRNLDLGVQLHGFVIKSGYLCDANIVTALVDMYSKSDNLKSAKIVFDGFSSKSIALFNAILVGFIKTNRDDDDEDAMVLFRQLRFAGIKPDLVTFSRLLSLSANQACLVKGETLHAYTIKTGFESSLMVSNALITMYAKCGSIEGACQIFDGMHCRDSVSWNAMVSAYSIHGQGKAALRLFKEIKGEGFAVDEFTILAILQACCYTGLWHNGIHIFNEMESSYKINPLIEHYACMVDLLGRAGCLSEAMNLISNSRFRDSPLLWRTLVNVCKLQGDIDFAMLASKNLLDLSPEEAGSFILVSNTYAGSGMLDEALKVRTAMNDLKLSKQAGCSWIEIDNKVHCFVASDKDHPESSEIYAKLDQLMDEIKWKNCDINDPHSIGEIV